MLLFRGASFFKSAASLEDVPASVGEIAFAGRSNSGKSSAINALAGNRLAFVSKTPGRTRLINYYALGADRFIVDLPGYGYARVPDAMRAPWEKLLGGYLQMREPLRGLALVMDVRHPLTELDQRMLRWFGPTGKPVHSRGKRRTRYCDGSKEKSGHLPPILPCSFSRVSGNPDSTRRRLCFEDGWIRARLRRSRRAAQCETKTPGKTRGWK